MRRQSNSSPQCCCHCNDHQTESPPVNRNNIYRESPTAKRNEYAVIRNGRCESDESAYYDDEPIDQQTRQTFANMRQKACRFITSETDCSTESDQGEYDCACKQGTNHGKGGSLLKQAQDSINYSPHSEFLKKFKNDFHCQCNVQEDQNSNECIPRICEQCIAKSNEIIKLLELLNAHGLAAANHQNEQSRPCQCSAQQGNEQDDSDEEDDEEDDCDEPSQNTSGINQIVKTCRSVVDELKNVLTTMGPYMNGECYNENMKGLNGSMNRIKQYENTYASHGGGECKPTGKSQHVSRSKKRVPCRGKRKRKSNESNEKCLSQEQFEPSLKQPHENSCERCWRYASPSRSPVNKPNQRYDPNFRRAHSCQDFLSTEGGQSEADRSPLGTPEKMTPVVSKRVNELGKCQGKDSERGPTKVKELASDQWSPRSKHRTGSPSAGSQKPRPKSCTPGTSTGARGNNPSSPKYDKGTQYMENRTKSPRGPCPPKNTNVKSKSPNASNQQIQNDSERNLKTRLKRSKGDSNLRIADFNAQRQKKQKSQKGGVQSGSECRECTCNKGQATRGEPSRRPQARPVTKSSPRGSPSPVRTQSSVFLESRGRNSPEIRPQTADYNSQAYCVGLQSPKTIGMNSREIRTGESKCCTCHGLSPRVPKPSTVQGCSPSSSKPKRYNCQHKSNAEEPMNIYNRNLPPRNAPKQSSDMNGNFYQGSDNCNVYDNSFNFRQDFGMNSMSNNTGRRAPYSFTPTSTENGETFTNSNYQENQRCCQKMNQTYPPAYRRNYSSRDQNQNLSFNVPKKYCVFYMTKSKNDKDNEVEVLVEELTERCKANNKDSKMAAVKEKMKKLDDCPLESMALRFQKGVNESSKNLRTESGRILYF